MLEFNVRRSCFIMLDRNKVLKWYKERFNKEPETVRWNEWKRACDIANDFDVLFYPSGDVNYNVLEAIEYAMDSQRIERIKNLLIEENGVMIWVDRKKELPEKTSYRYSDNVLVYNDNGTKDVTNYDFEKNRFSAEKNYNYGTKTTHWAYITNPKNE